MSGPNEPQDQSGNAAGQEPTQQWARPGSAAQGAEPTQAFDASSAGHSPAGQAPQWGPQPGQGGAAGAPGGQAQPQWGQTGQQWGQPPVPGQQPWGQAAAGAQWGQQPAQPQQQWGQPQPQPGQQWGQGAPVAGQQWGQPQQQWGQPQPGQQWAPQPQPGQQPPWGQPAAGQQPWGQPQPGQQPQWAPAQAGQQPPKSKKPLILGLGALALVLILAIVGVLVATSLGSKTLDSAAAEAGVAKVLTQSYGATAVDDVSCPDGQKVESGNSFECTVTVDGQHRSVTLTFTDDEGTYEVSRPN